MTIKGKIHEFFFRSRIFTIVNKNKKYHLKVSIKDFEEFSKVLFFHPTVIVHVRKMKNIGLYEVLAFRLIVIKKHGKRIVYYSQEFLQNEIKKLLRSFQNKLFLDLEFTLPNRNQISEIVEYGIVLDNNHGEIIFQEKNFLKPFFESSINEKTLEFLTISKDKIKKGKSYLAFYKLLENLINEHNPKIIAWGRGDLMILEKSFRINHLKPLDIRNRYINIMQIIKNYLGEKQELGLFDVYTSFSHTTKELVQHHDALVDAQMARSNYYMFLNKINEK